SAFWKAACVPDATAGERRALAAAGYAVFADPGRAVRGLALALRHRQLLDLAQRVPGHVVDIGSAAPRPGAGGDGR
ncbi:hypothetical protein ACKI1Q_46245, partial [Streptomyces galilaeus]|uniref:hypothetical protein n=1 Tax=Streptomyces galilaeus TaxID=33899 RepID=UPI0038F6669B